jgi:A/G-specific adenine glycosylase
MPISKSRTTEPITTQASLTQSSISQAPMNQPSTTQTTITQPSIFSKARLDWYDQHARDLPWRQAPGSAFLPDPYKIWISEIMLQQTTVSAVVPYFQAFMQVFPCVQDLAQADMHNVLNLWQGLGYYRRAHYLHQAAMRIAEQGWPTNEQEWLALPGIGPYTAAALTCIALNQPAVALDGNLFRIFSRYFQHNGTDWKARVRQSAQTVLAQKRWGDYTQALMDLGSRICRPRQPLCHMCPVNQACQAFLSQTTQAYPPKTMRSKKQRAGHVFLWMYQDQKEGKWYVRLCNMPPHGLLKGLWGFPTSTWDEVPVDGVHVQNPPGMRGVQTQTVSALSDLATHQLSFFDPVSAKNIPCDAEASHQVFSEQVLSKQAPCDQEIFDPLLSKQAPSGLEFYGVSDLPTPYNHPLKSDNVTHMSSSFLPNETLGTCIGSVRHVFTHFTLHLDVWVIQVSCAQDIHKVPIVPKGQIWVPLPKISSYPFSSLMTKVYQHYIQHKESA